MDSQTEQEDKKYRVRLIASNCLAGACPAVYEVVASACVLGACPGIYAEKSQAGEAKTQNYVIVGRQLGTEELQESGLAEKVGQGESAVEIPLDLIKRVLA